MTLRVLVVSDVRMVQEGLNLVLAQEEQVDVIGTADIGNAKDESTRLRPDVVLIDAARQSSFGFVKDLVAAAPASKVVAFGVKESDDSEVLALAAAGTAGYVCDSAAGCDVVRVLERVMCDELQCSPRTAASLYRRVAVLSPSSDRATGQKAGGALPLSRRELQIVHLIERGLSNKEIGRHLGIEPATVKNHVHNICEKLQVHRRADVIARVRVMLGARAPVFTEERPGPPPL
jgi:two-component system, NarL family, nitrate/nitrite response regulator NarL